MDLRLQQKNALFCFPCLLFGGDKAWTETGVKDLVHLSEKIKKHENSKSHVYNQMELSLFGKVNIQAQLDSAYWTNIQKHNEKVAKNRYVLSKIIECIKFCGAFELALRGHDETESSENPGIFRGLINFSADNTLSEHLQNATVFKGTSKEIQNDLLDCILKVCHTEIMLEISETPFLAVLGDETTDVSAKFQLVTILRYVTKSGDPVERFWNFLLPTGHDAETLSCTILSVVDPIISGYSQKLIAQSYDGASVMSGKHGGVQAKIREQYPYAYFVHCYAHQLNLLMEKDASANSKVRVFFGNLNDIPGFFSHSPQRVAVLDRIVGRKVPSGSSTRWNFNIRTINVVYEHRASLIECMEELEEGYNQKTCSQASAIRRMLQDSTFIFWLTFFYHVMPHVDILFHQLQKRKIDTVEVNKAINMFEKSIENIRNTIDNIINEANLNTDGELVQVKRKRHDNSNEDRRIAAIEVCDVIITTSKDRFAFTDHLIAAQLCFSENFVSFYNRFPDNILELACSAYPILMKERLKTELSVIYSRSDCRDIHGAVPFLKFLIENNLEDTMKETKKLLLILITIPMTTAEAERCFSTLKRIKTFLRNAMSEERLTALAMLSVEKKFISNISKFNDKVIDEFASKKNRRIDLEFKK